MVRPAGTDCMLCSLCFTADLAAYGEAVAPGGSGITGYQDASSNLHIGRRLAALLE